PWGTSPPASTCWPSWRPGWRRSRRTRTARSPRTGSSQSPTNHQSFFCQSGVEQRLTSSAVTCINVGRYVHPLVLDYPWKSRHDVTASAAVWRASAPLASVRCRASVEILGRAGGGARGADEPCCDFGCGGGAIGTRRRVRATSGTMLRRGGLRSIAPLPGGRRRAGEAGG